MDENSENKEVEIFWNYTPPDFFEEPFRLDLGEYSFDIGGGRAATRVSTDHYDADPNLEESLTKRLRDGFLWAQSFCRKPYKITCGGINHWPLTGPRRGMIRYGHFGLVVIAPEGTDVEVRRNRIEGMKRLAQLSFAQAPDLTAHKIMKSYSDSIAHPDDEMAYLFDIWDALQTKFRTWQEAAAALDMAEELGRFYALTCSREFKQGRHRGKHDILREAPPEELNEVRGMALRMIEKYLQYLGEQGQGGQRIPKVSEGG